MDITKWNVAILHTDRSQETDILFETIHNFFSILPFKKTDLILSPQYFSQALKENGSTLFIVPSYSKQYLMEALLKTAYCEDSPNTLWVKHKFFIIPLGESKVIFTSIDKVFNELDIKFDTKPLTDIFKTLTCLFKDEEKNRNIPSYKIRNAIEKICFPSGAEEILEVINRDSAVIHEVFNKLNKNDEQPRKISHESSKFPAIRLLMGAYAAGDISDNTLRYGIKEIDKKLEDAELEKVLNDWIAEVDQEIKDLKLIPDYLSPLSEYLAGRKILLIEDKLDNEYWNIVLPFLFYPINYNGPYNEIQEDIENQPFGEISLTHKKSARGLMDEDLSEYDLILLDLYSSENNFSTHGNIYSTIPTSITDFIEKIAKYYDDDDSVKKVLPNIIIFSADSSGVTARALLKDLKVTEYFFKLSDSESHKGEYYSTFRNAVINSLKEKVLRVTGLNGIEDTRRFNKWYSQFHQKDRPLLLRVMQFFRYYSALNISKIMDNYIKDTPQLEIGNNTISLFSSDHLPPSQHWFSHNSRANKSGPSTLVLLGKAGWIKNLKGEDNLASLVKKQPLFKEYYALQRELN